MISTTHKLLLDILGCRIFGSEMPGLDSVNLIALLREANAQTVYTMVFPCVEDAVRVRLPERYDKLNEKYLAALIVNTGNFHDHGELHELMHRENIPYVVLKGFASAYYYPDPQMRNMGDIDFLVSGENVDAAGKALESIGFTRDHGGDGDNQIAYRRPLLSIWELHRAVNGIPEGELGKRIQKEIDTTIDSSRLVEHEGTSCRIPDHFHHGLVMLLHTAKHLTSEGVGLRHLCDWAVFASGFDDDAFRGIFEKKLRDFGLWHFARILTRVCEKFLHAPVHSWAQGGDIREELIDGLASDIISGGNFGTKDMNRYREIKYIRNHGGETVDKHGIFSHLFSSLNNKVYTRHSFINKHRFLLPLGWIAEGGRYTALLVTGKRKTASTSEMLKEAKLRKDLYSEMKLFSGEKES